MPPREWRIRIQDVLDGIREIDEYTADVSFQQYQEDRLLRRAVERCFEIIGEAAGHVPPEIQQRYPHVPWKRMRNMRNVISHVYFKVNDRVVWDTLKNDLPPLVPALEDLLVKEPGTDDAGS